MKNKQYKLDIIPGIVIALFSIGYMAMIPSIKTFTGLGATPLTNHFVPYLWAAPTGTGPVDYGKRLPQAQEVPGGRRDHR